MNGCLFKKVNRTVVLIVCVALGVVAASAQTLSIQSEDGKETKIGKAELAKLKRVTLKVSDHGKEAIFEGVILADVLKLGGIELGEKLRGKQLATFLLVEAADNYKAVFALPELDAGFTDKMIILADKRDGKDLAENARPWQIVVEGEKRAARSVRQVTTLRILRAGTEKSGTKH